jgi:uncharacterized membrane-anchored protein
VLFAVVIAIPAIAHAAFRMNAVLAFWAAYVVTRPLGASFADWFGVGPERGGVGLGTGPVSLVGLVAFVVLVTWLSVRRPDVERADVHTGTFGPEPARGDLGSSLG